MAEESTDTLTLNVLPREGQGETEYKNAAPFEYGYHWFLPDEWAEPA